MMRHSVFGLQIANFLGMKKMSSEFFMVLVFPLLMTIFQTSVTQASEINEIKQRQMLNVITSAKIINFNNNTYAPHDSQRSLNRDQKIFLNYNWDIDSEARSVALEYLLYSQEVFNYFLNLQQRQNLKKFQLSRLRMTLMNFTHGGILVTDKQFFIDQVEKHAFNDPECACVMVSLQAWKKATPRQKVLIVIHELLGASGLDDSKYQLTTELMNFSQDLWLLNHAQAMSLFSEQPRYLMPFLIPTLQYNNGYRQDSTILSGSKTSIFYEGKRHACLGFEKGEVYLDLRLLEIANTKKIYLHWLVVCLFEDKRYELRPNVQAFRKRTADVSSKMYDPVYDLDGSWLIQEGKRVGWFSGDEIFLQLNGVSIKIKHLHLKDHIYGADAFLPFLDVTFKNRDLTIHSRLKMSSRSLQIENLNNFELDENE